MLGGVVVSGEGVCGLEGHSDGDAVAHAVCDAVFGAAGLGDLGHHAPDTDPACEGADSVGLLARVVALAAAGRAGRRSTPTAPSWPNARDSLRTSRPWPSASARCSGRRST